MLSEAAIDSVHLWRFAIWLTGILAGILIFAIAILYFRQRTKSRLRRQDNSVNLSDMQAMRDSGQLTPEEYEMIRFAALGIKKKPAQPADSGGQADKTGDALAENVAGAESSQAAEVPPRPAENQSLVADDSALQSAEGQADRPDTPDDGQEQKAV